MAGEPRAGLLAEFPGPDEMLRALRGLREDGYSQLGTYSPYPLDEAVEMLGFRRPPLARWALGAGLLGAALAFGVQWYTNAWDYPINVGSRPLLAIPAWIQITVASGILFAALAVFVGFCVAARLLTLWHPVFEIEEFEHASVDRSWAAVGSDDPRYHPLRTAEALHGYGALRVVSFREDG